MLNMEFTETVKIQNKNNKNKKNKSKKEVTYNYNYLVVAGRSGVMCLVDIFGDKTKEYEHFDIIKGGAYRGLCKISKTRFAVTSNSIINDGMNKLIIYNFDNDENKNTENNKKRGKIEFPKDENDATDNISFIASNFGMATLSENILLCACKKYTSKDKNGIFMVIIPNEKNANFTKMFFETGEFEVHCICPINKKSQNSFIINTSNSNNNNFEEQNLKKDYFLVGGFDSKFGEGRIKLYKLDKKNEEIQGIKFVQDIEIHREEEEPNFEEKKKENYKIFDGAISSLIQLSSDNENILASCYDGRVYKLSAPNLKSYKE
jgi:hypothetical protein